MKTKVLGMVGLIFLSLAGVALWQKSTRQAWWASRQILAADPTEEQVQALQSQGEAIFPYLIAGLQSDDEPVARRAELALHRLLAAAKDSRPIEFLVQRFLDQTPPSALRLLAGALEPSRELSTDLMARLFEIAKRSATRNDLKAGAILLTAGLVERLPPSRENAIRLVHEGSTGSDPAVRSAVLHLGTRPSLLAVPGLVEKLQPLLRDREVAVRRTAIVLLGPLSDFIADEELLTLLHDGDPQVQRQCEVVLLGRGLSDQHIELARLITDDRPVARLEVLQHLRNADVDPGVWLKRLCQDPAPAVRAAGVRAAGGLPSSDLRRLVEQMATHDPSATVRELAGFYASRGKRND